MPRRFWWPGSMPEQVVVMQNFSAKIGGYETKLGLTTEQVDEIVNVCNAFVAAFNAVEQCKLTMQGVTQWRENAFYGTDGALTPTAPTFPALPTLTTRDGLVPEFIKFRDLLLTLPNYTTAIGEDLGIIGAEITAKPADEISPKIKNVSANGVNVSITGSMQGFDAMRVEYAPTGGNFAPVAFLTNTPATFQVPGVSPGQPQMGYIRTVYIKKNDVYGNYSANYPVTLT